MDTPCTCGHDGIVEHDTRGACTQCPCPDFVTDDVALAAAVGVLESGEHR